MSAIHVTMYYSHEPNRCHHPKVVRICVDMFGLGLILAQQQQQHSMLLVLPNINLGNKKTCWQHLWGSGTPIYLVFDLILRQLARAQNTRSTTITMSPSATRVCWELI